jgi:heterotetrameric sarcosine oxidase gamma subunit
VSEPVTTGPLTTGPATTGPATTGPATTGPATTGPIARSPIGPAVPVVVLDGWEVSGRRADGAALTLTDCAPLAKLQLRAPIGGRAAQLLGVPFGRAARDATGTLVVGSGPGEWLLLGPPGAALGRRLEQIIEQAADESASWVDLTHGRAMMRLNGPPAAGVLRKLCGVDLSDAITPAGAAFRSAVASLATDVIRDDYRGAPSYLLHCERSSGQYLFDAVLGAGAEFGIAIDGFTPPGI